MASRERVLVLPRARVPGGCDFHGMRPAEARELAELRGAVGDHGILLDREMAEGDPDFKQLVPYVVIRDGERVFVMRRSRAGADRRLHDRMTIGVGGHLDETDARSADPIATGLLREWREELETDWTPEYRLLGFLNDDSNPVGSVHLGVVFQVDAAGRRVDVRERDKLSGSFQPLAALRGAWDSLETWSQLVAESLAAR